MRKTSRDRDRGRKYLNGNQILIMWYLNGKRALTKAKEAENEKQRCYQ